jgi:leucyl-tRNA synthetase
MVSAWSQESVETDWYVKGTDTAVEQRLGKMGKSLNNSVDPLDIVAEYGADTLRIYEMFMGPLEAVKPWQTSGCEGVYRFLSRVWRLFVDEDTGETRPFGPARPEVTRALHVALKEATEGIEALRLNTPISKMMELVNTCKGQTPDATTAEHFVVALSPWAPHLAEELWRRFGHTHTIVDACWPAWDPAALVEDTVTIAIQVLGKLRGTVDVPRGASADTVLAAAREVPSVARFLEGKEVVKEVHVPGKLVNFVVR